MVPDSKLKYYLTGFQSDLYGFYSEFKWQNLSLIDELTILCIGAGTLCTPAS